jgi:MraZ protein
VFRGSSATKIDDKGRLKLPTGLRRQLESSYGPDVFITSVRGTSVHIYPLQVWAEIEAALTALPKTDQVKQRFLERTSYYGREATLDKQGRVVVPPILRQSAEMEGDVVVSARLDHLEVWNQQRLLERFAEQPFTDDDYGYLSERGI